MGSSLFDIIFQLILAILNLIFSFGSMRVQASRIQASAMRESTRRPHSPKVQ